jgi:hypothetical protein
MKEQVLPMICRGLDSNIVEIQEAIFQKIPAIMGKNDASVLKDSLLPR